MRLESGTRLGHYEIGASIGAGGMGEVYRGKDTRLKREVALKVLPEAFAGDDSRMARFQREAEVVASLNHPNIAHVYGVEEHALVMELVEGESPKGPMPFEDAWRIALQIADALEYAHERGIIHRDLKPANIKVTPDGVVKLLDFGLAKAFSEAPESSGGDPMNSPTLTMGVTVAGTILGTAAYMAPEQAKGRKVDKRADIWSWGVVLYELITGERLFQGEDIAETLAQVLTKQPDFEKAPTQVRNVLRRCIEKDPKKRLRDIGEARYLLDDVTAPAISGPAEAAPVHSHRRFAGWAAAALLAAALAGLSYVHFREPSATADPPKVRFDIPAPTNAPASQSVLSPNGRYLAIASGRNRRAPLLVRPLDAPEPQPLPGTDGAVSPFWSPDSSSIAFFVDGKLKRISVNGGQAQTLCDADSAGLGAWGENDVIVFAVNSKVGLNRVSAAGGVPAAVTKTVTAGEIHRYPSFLPGGRRFLYTVTTDKPGAPGIYVGSLDSAPPVQLLPDESSSSFASKPGQSGSGYVLFARGTTLMAQPFDPERIRLSGEMFPIAEQLLFGQGIGAGYAFFSVSSNGILSYRTGVLEKSQLTWMDRRGNNLGNVGEPQPISDAALSPNGTKIAVSITETPTSSSLWIFDASGGAPVKLTAGLPMPAVAAAPVWSPDGTRIAYSVRGNSAQRDIYLRPANGAGKETLLFHTTGSDAYVTDWSPDARFILYYQTDPDGSRRKLWLLPVEGDHKPLPYLQTASAVGANGQFSPDGRWLAYNANESGKQEVYVGRFPDTGEKWPISKGGGVQPRWRADGKALFYADGGKLMEVAVKADATFTAGTPQMLFDTGAPVRLRASYQPTADGTKFLILSPQEDTKPPEITVLVNWLTGSRK